MSKDDISNRTLGILVGVAIVVSLLGILSAKQPEVFYYLLTGFQTAGNGTVTTEITRNNVISVTGTINFGTGYIYGNNSDQPFLLNSTSTYAGGGNRCSPNATFAGSSCQMGGGNSTNRFIVQNDGNINVTIIMDINTTQSNLQLGTGGDFAFWLGQEETGTNILALDYRPACLNRTGGTNPGDPESYYFPNVTGFRTGTTGMPVSIYSVIGHAPGSSQVKICEKLQSDDLYDSINVTIYLNISKSATIGAKNYLLNFTAVDAFPTEG